MAMRTRTIYAMNYQGVELERMEAKDEELKRRLESIGDELMRSDIGNVRAGRLLRALRAGSASGEE
jgi:hypothetical protein